MVQRHLGQVDAVERRRVRPARLTDEQNGQIAAAGRPSRVHLRWVAPAITAVPLPRPSYGTARSRTHPLVATTRGCITERRLETSGRRCCGTRPTTMRMTRTSTLRTARHRRPLSIPRLRMRSSAPHNSTDMRRTTRRRRSMARPSVERSRMSRTWVTRRSGVSKQPSTLRLPNLRTQSPALHYSSLNGGSSRCIPLICQSTPHQTTRRTSGTQRWYGNTQPRCSYARHTRPTSSATAQSRSSYS